MREMIEEALQAVQMKIPPQMKTGPQTEGGKLPHAQAERGKLPHMPRKSLFGG